MQTELKALQREVGITFIFVTHDQEEAMALSDRIALLRSGFLEQIAEPREIYGQPASAYVAQFIGQTNLLRAEVRDGLVQSGPFKWRTAETSGQITFSLRPECIRLVATGIPLQPNNDSIVRFPAHVLSQTFGGAMDTLELDCGTPQTLRSRIASPGTLSGQYEFEFRTSDAIAVREEDST
jgi:ABC-type Fe3+/spermidine/putrescine transport system ATPase subunit